MSLTKIKKNLIKVCDLFNLGELVSYEKELSHQNNVYKVTTNKGTYIVKEFTKDAISNYYYLNKRKKQIKIAEKLNKHNINCLIPKRLHKRYFFFINKNYYLVYDYSKSKVLMLNEMTDEHIKILATTQSKIHKLNLKMELPCFYKKINIDFNKLLKDGKNNKEFLSFMNENKDKLEDLINKCNKNIKLMKDNLCISHNDYKPLNILWDNLNPTLIDFDASAMSNPTCSLAESAYTFSYMSKSINYENYKVYLENYLKAYGPLQEDYKLALYVSMNGKLQWYNYLISKKNFNDILGMSKELIIYYENIEKFYEIYKSIV